MMWVKILLLLVVLQCAQAELKMQMTRFEGKSMRLLREGKFFLISKWATRCFFGSVTAMVIVSRSKHTKTQSFTMYVDLQLLIDVAAGLG
jgi:hypothetical protein